MNDVIVIPAEHLTSHKATVIDLLQSGRTGEELMQPGPEPRICASCGRSFIPIRSEQQLCSHYCRATQQRRLTNEQATAIRRDYQRRKVTLAQLANQYGVSATTVYSIVHGDTYRDVEAACAA